MIELRIDGLDVQVEEGSSLLDVAQFMAYPFPHYATM
ncbi:hypothetical protein MBGDF03_00813, partial [Thermoplasmatales archaeon SCGC AB-540-F20]